MITYHLKKGEETILSWDVIPRSFQIPDTKIFVEAAGSGWQLLGEDEEVLYQIDEEVTADPPPPPPIPQRTWKSDIWDRATEEEAEAIEAGMAAQSPKMRNFFMSIAEIRHDHALFPFLHNLFKTAFGEERANALLAPSQPIV